MSDDKIWVHRDFDFRKIQKIEINDVPKYPKGPKQIILYYGDSEASAEKIEVLDRPQDIGTNIIRSLKSGDKCIYLTQIVERSQA